MKKSFLLVLTLCGWCLLTSCGGGGSTTPPPVATHFSVAAPATGTAGTTFSFTVTALDASNNVATAYSGTVHFASTDGQAMLPADSRLTNGMGSFSATLKTVASQTITATDTVTATITGTSSSINISAAPATHFSVTAPAGAAAGSLFSFTVTALDTSNSAVTGYSGTVHFTSTDGRAVLPANSTLTNGTADFPARLNSVGSQTLTATDTVTASITGTSKLVNVSAASAANPVPLINQPLSPAAAVPGGGAFTLTVNGTGFVSGSVVNWNGSARATHFVSHSRLTASVLASDIANANTASVTVVNPVPGGGTSNLAFFNVTFPTASISLSASQFGVGAAAISVATGDFNGDGKLDLAVANLASNNVSILLGNGDGTFQAAVNYDVGSTPLSVAVGDFNGDGKLDLVVANAATNNVSVLLGKGDGTFQAAVNYGTGANPVSVTVGDFNGDGKLDLAVANEFSNNVGVLLGNGDGTFQAALNYGAGAQPFSVAVGDFNGDGKLDLVVANNGNSNVSVLLGNGDGTFQAAVNYSAGGTGPVSVAVGDFNGDGKLDLAVSSNNISVLLGNGDGTFQAAVNYGTGGNGVVVGDFNGDGKLDLAVASDPGNSVSILMGKGDGTFQSAVSYAAGKAPPSVAVGDFNGEGRLDLAAADNFSGQAGSTVSVLLQGTVQLSETALTFANQVIGTGSAAQSVTLTNIGRLAVNLTSIGITGTNASEFSAANNCGPSVASGASCTINVTFTPAQVGPRTASLVVMDDAPGSPQSLALRGTGLTTGQNATLSATTLTFATQLVSTTSAAQPVTLTNFGTTTLSITSITAATNFGETDNCGSSVASGASCTISVTFTPGTRGGLSGTLSLADNAPGSPQTVSLNGTGTVVSLVPAALIFSCNVPGRCHTNNGCTAPPQTVALTNTGSTALNITSVTITANPANFTQTNNCPTSLGAGLSCAIRVGFSSGINACGIAPGTLSVSDDGGGSPQTVSLAGRVLE